MRTLRWLVIADICLIVADIGLFIAGIWTDDARWAQTGVVVLVMAGVTAAVTGAAAEAVK